MHLQHVSTRFLDVKSQERNQRNVDVMSLRAKRCNPAYVGRTRSGRRLIFLLGAARQSRLTLGRIRTRICEEVLATVESNKTAICRHFLQKLSSGIRWLL